jgi:hypothetical protein
MDAQMVRRARSLDALRDRLSCWGRDYFFFAYGSMPDASIARASSRVIVR